MLQSGKSVIILVIKQQVPIKGIESLTGNELMIARIDNNNRDHFLDYPESGLKFKNIQYIFRHLSDLKST